jgi:hypothetical protein
VLLKQIVNEALREGLAPSRRSPAAAPVSDPHTLLGLPLVGSLVNVEEKLDVVEPHEFNQCWSTAQPARLPASRDGRGRLGPGRAVALGRSSVGAHAHTAAAPGAGYAVLDTLAGY